MRGPALMDEAGNIIFLLGTGDGDLSFGLSTNREALNTLNGGRFSYNIGSYYTADLLTTMVSSAEVLRIRQWWRDGDRLRFNPLATIGGDNLQINGDAEDPNNNVLNFFSNVAISTVAPYDGTYSHVCSEFSTSMRSLERIEIDDVNALYAMSFAWRTTVASQETYAGFLCYDKDGNFIRYEQANHTPGMMTKLYTPFPVGSAYMDIVPSVNTWTAAGASGALFQVSSDRSDLPNQRSLISISSVATSLSTSYWRVHFDNANTSYYPAGTRVVQSDRGSSFNYILSAALSVNSDWNVSSGHFGLGVSPTDAGPNATPFRIGTRFIRFGMLVNRTFSGQQTFVDNIVIKKQDAVYKAGSYGLAQEFFIANKSDPIKRSSNGDPGLFECTLNLESF